MKRTYQILLFVLALAFMFGGVMAGRWFHGQFAEKEVGLNSAFTDLNGKPQALSQWKGKVVIVNFWASWCPSCVEEMPEFAKLQTELGERGLQFVGLLIDDEVDLAEEFLKQHPVNYPILNGNIGGREFANNLGNGTGALPFSVVFDRNGKIVHRQLGAFKREEVLKQVLPLLQ